MAEKVPRSEVADRVRTGYDDIPSGSRHREFESRLSAAKSEIGGSQMELAARFNACVRGSTGLYDYRYNSNIEIAEPTIDVSGGLNKAGPGQISGFDARDLTNIATAQCAAKIYGGPGGQ